MFVSIYVCQCLCGGLCGYVSVAMFLDFVRLLHDPQGVSINACAVCACFLRAWIGGGVSACVASITECLQCQ